MSASDELTVLLDRKFAPGTVGSLYEVQYGGFSSPSIFSTTVTRCTDQFVEAQQADALKKKARPAGQREKKIKGMENAERKRRTQEKGLQQYTDLPQPL